MPREADNSGYPASPQQPLWPVPFAADDVPETGSHVELEADEAVRAEVAKSAGLNALPSLRAVFEITRRARGIKVTGQVEATVGQTCVVTLEPVENRVLESFDLLFAPPDDPAFSGDEPPEPLVDGTIDLGAIAVEFLMLGIDPYPRKEGAEFVNPAASDDGTSPFSALAGLKKGSSSS